MNRSKRAVALFGGILLVWAGFGQLGVQTPLASEHQTPESRPQVMRQAEANGLPPAGSVDLRSQMHQPTTILSVVPPGKTVQKGDLLVELDNSDLVDKRVQQVFQARKTETDWVVARESQHWEKQAASGQIELAEKALRLAQSQLKAFTEGEHPNELAHAEGAARIAKMKRMLAEERYTRLRTSYETQKDQAALAALQEAQIALDEAALQLQAAANALSGIKGFVRDNKVAELELAVAQREFDLARAKDALSAATAKSVALVQLAEMSYQREADRLAKLDDEIARCKVYAPQDGIVASPDDAGAVAIRVGAVVRPGQVLVRLLPVTSSQ